MSRENDDVLSLSDSDSDFSGFTPEDIQVGANETVATTHNSPKRKGLKSVISKPKVSSSKTTGVKTPTARKDKTPSSTKKAAVNKENAAVKQNNVEQPNLINLDKLTPENVVLLRQALGLQGISQLCQEENEIETEPREVPYRHERPNLRVEFENQGPDSDVEFTYGDTYRSPLQTVDFDNNNLENALFDGSQSSNVDLSTQKDDIQWDLPKLKAPQLGENISPSLAKLIATACTSQCVTEEIIERYKIPQNCEEMGAPRIDSEIFESLDKRAQGNDKNFRTIQQLVATAMMPVVKLASILKDQIGQNPEA